jgi:hypothetical protein
MNNMYQPCMAALTAIKVIASLFYWQRTNAIAIGFKTIICRKSFRDRCSSVFDVFRKNSKKKHLLSKTYRCDFFIKKIFFLIIKWLIYKMN